MADVVVDLVSFDILVLLVTLHEEHRGGGAGTRQAPEGRRMIHCSMIAQIWQIRSILIVSSSK